MASEAQRSFAGGELGDDVLGRLDISKYQVGLKAARNCMVTPEGPCINRAGTIYVDASPAAPRLIPFRFDANEQYVLVFTNLEMRVIKGGTLGFIQAGGGGDFVLATPFTAAEIAIMGWVQREDVVYLLSQNHAPRRLSRIADNNWTLETLTFGPSILAPTNPSAVWTSDGDDTAPRNSKYKLSTVKLNGEESLPTAEFDTGSTAETLGYIDLSWDAVTDADEYIIYKEENGRYGYIGRSETTTFRDEGIDPDTSDTPQRQTDFFTGTGEYPLVGARAQQRLALANKINQPMQCVFSQSNNRLENFNFSRPVQADDAIDLTGDAKFSGEIRALVNLERMIMFTSDEVFLMVPTDGNVLQPGQIELRRIYEVGCAPIEPLVILDEVLFVEDTLDRVISLRANENYLDRLDNQEMSVLAPHLFRGNGVARMSYARSPYSIAPCVMTNGTVSCLTRHKEHDSYPWCSWTTKTAAGQSSFLDVTTIREGNRDVPYFCIQRTVNGATVYSIEKLADRYEQTVEDMVFVDMAGTYEGAPTSTPNGFDHLEGETVDVLADGKVYKELTVSGGAVSLSSDASKVTAGIRTDWFIIPLPLRSAREYVKHVSRVYLNVYDSATIVIEEVERDDEDVEHPPTPLVYGGSAQLTTEVLLLDLPSDGDDPDGIFKISSPDPLPFNLRGMRRIFQAGKE